MIRYLLYKKYCTGSTSYKDLKQWYYKKKRGFVEDYTIDRMEHIFRDDFKVTVCNHITKSGHEALYVIYDAENLIGRTAFNVKLDLIGLKGEKRIRDCTLKEFLKIYGPVL